MTRGSYVSSDLLIRVVLALLIMEYMDGSVGSFFIAVSVKKVICEEELSKDTWKSCQC